MRLRDLVPVELPNVATLPIEVHIGPGLRHHVGDLARPFVGQWPLALLDPHTSSAVGAIRVGDHRRFVLPSHPHADEATVRRVAQAIDGATGVIAVGSGTINDLAKRASTVRDELPFVVLGTAASMNGYASAIAAILANGVKTTVAARPARAIILDTEVLAAAPAALTQAGIGDLLSKPVSDSCWWLADQIEGTGYSTLPGSIVDAAVAEASAAAAGLARRDLESHAALGRALTLSGVAMVVAGSSSPASGGEHLISHLWDMRQLAAGLETRLHGAQVGVATCISAALYQRLLAIKKPKLAATPTWASEEARIRAEHGPLAEAILPLAQRKHARAEARRAVLRDRWSEIRDGLEARSLPTPQAVRSILQAAGAPSTLAELGVSRTDAAEVFRQARDIRDRFTVLDVAFALGILPGEIDALLNAAGV
jgi:glycerol-1-phosphate dehydrogenase [NAD(P)+]